MDPYAGFLWYLLNKLFGLRPSEIAEMEGLDKKNSSVRQLIIRVAGTGRGPAGLTARDNKHTKRHPESRGSASLQDPCKP